MMSYLQNFKRFEGGYVAFGSGNKGGNITGKGLITKGMMTFSDVFYVEQLKYNSFVTRNIVYCSQKQNVFFFLLDSK